MVNLKLVPYNDAYSVRQIMPFVQPSNGLMCPFKMHVTPGKCKGGVDVNAVCPSYQHHLVGISFRDA